MKRKEFLQTGLRLGILTGIVGGSIFLVRRNQIDYSCKAEGACKSCSLYRRCDLDQAKETRANER